MAGPWNPPGRYGDLAAPCGGGSLGGEPFAVADMSPALIAAYDELIGPGRQSPLTDVGAAVVVRFPSEDHANAGYHIEGSYRGPAPVTGSTCDPGHAGCSRCSCSPTWARMTHRRG